MNFLLLSLILLWRSQKVGLLKQIVIQIREIRARAGEPVEVQDDTNPSPMEDERPDQEDPWGENHFALLFGDNINMIAFSTSSGFRCKCF